MQEKQYRGYRLNWWFNWENGPMNPYVSSVTLGVVGDDINKITYPIEFSFHYEEVEDNYDKDGCYSYLLYYGILKKFLKEYKELTNA
jgi:hypothetical protein